MSRPFHFHTLYLEQAIRNADLNACVAALDAGADPNARIVEDGRNMLIRAVLEGFLDGVRLLLDRGAKVDGTDRIFVPLIVAARMGNAAIFRELIDRGADVDLANDLQISALHVACQKENAEAVELLLARGVSPDKVRSIDGHTALHEAVIGMEPQALSIVRRLVEAGADPSFMAEQGRSDYMTPFQTAVFYGRDAITSYFLDDCHEDPLQTTIEGRSMVHLAGNSDVEGLLRAAIVTKRINAAVSEAQHSGSAHIASPSSMITRGPL